MTAPSNRAAAGVRRTWLLSLMLLLALAPAAVAAPSSKVIKEAELRFKRGNERYNEGKYQEALLLYQAAYGLLPSVTIVFNLGLTYEKLLDYEACALAFQQFLREAAPADDRTEATTRAEGCRSRARIPVKVSTMPPGAAVSIGDAGSARFLARTPAALELAPGSYDLRITLAGHEPHDERITVDVGTRPSYDFVLERLSSLRIEADVAGASARIDDGPEESTPLERELSAGTYSVVVTRAGYVPVRREVRISSGREVQLSISLVPIAEVRVVRVRTTPALAALRVDGGPAAASPLELSVAPGRHELSIVAPGHLDYRGELLVPSGRDLDLVAKLPRKRSRRSRALLWTLGGTSAALAVAGTIFGLRALDDEAEYRDNPSRDLRDSGLDNRFRADVLLGSALVATAGGVVYYLLTRPGRARLEASP